VLETAAFSKDLRGVNLAAASVSNAVLHSCDLQQSNLTGLSWAGGGLRRTSLADAVTRGARFETVFFQNIDFRRADFSDTAFRECRFRNTVVRAEWRTNSSEVLLAFLENQRVIAIVPESGVVTPVDLGGAGYVSPEHPFRHEQLGELRHTSTEWRVVWNSSEGMPFEAGVQAEFPIRYAGGGDVEILDLKITNRTTGLEILSRQIVDASFLGGQGTRVLAISRSGRQLAIVSGRKRDVETAALATAGKSEDLPIQNFAGRSFEAGPETIDTRGAAFSPSESLIAICDQPDTIGFWQTETGELVGRVTFVPETAGCIIDGATGLPDWFNASNPGWIWEGPVKQ
jgi:hypothetical protein